MKWFDVITLGLVVGLVVWEFYNLKDRIERIENKLNKLLDKFNN